MISELSKRNGLLIVETADGRLLAELKKSMWSEKATGTVQGQAWTFDKNGSAKIAYCDGAPSVVLTADRPSMWRQDWALSCGTLRYEIKPRGAFSNAYDVTRDGILIGESLRAGFWSSYPRLNVPDEVPVEHVVFLLWIAYLMRNRAASTTASTTI